MADVDPNNVHEPMTDTTPPPPPPVVPDDSAPTPIVPDTVAEDGPTRLFIGNLAWATTNDSLHGAFDDHNKGSVVEARVIYDHDTRRSKGFGFVKFRSPQDAAKAMREMNGVAIDGRYVRVAIANSRN